MRALILAAGRGVRMGPATDARPKGLVPLHGRPLLAWQLDVLRAAGIDDVALVRGYRAEDFAFDVTYFDNPRWAETSMVASLACAAEWLAAGTTLVTYADIVYSGDVVERLAGAEGDLVVPYDANWLELWQRRFADPLSDAETFAVDERGALRDIGRRTDRLEEVGGQYMGLVRLTPAGARRLLARHAALEPAARDAADMTSMLARLVAAGDEVRTVPFDGWWCEVDSPADLAVAEEIVTAARAADPRDAPGD